MEHFQNGSGIFFFFSGKVPNFLKNLIIFKINIIYKKKSFFLIFNFCFCYFICKK